MVQQSKEAVKGFCRGGGEKSAGASAGPVGCLGHRPQLPDGAPVARGGGDRFKNAVDEAVGVLYDLVRVGRGWGGGTTGHSWRMASIGLRRAARVAGYVPKSTPTVTATAPTIRIVCPVRAAWNGTSVR